GGEQPVTKRGNFPYPEIDKAAFALNNGQTSEVLQTPTSFDIIQMIDKQEGKVQPLTAELRGKIEKALKDQKTAAMTQQINSAALADAQTMGIDKAAAKYGVAPV